MNTHKNKDLLTLWIRKEELPPRVLKVSLSWVRRLSALVSGTFLVGVIGFLVGLAFFWKSRQPTDHEATRRIEELSSELALLKSNRTSDNPLKTPDGKPASGNVDTSPSTANPLLFPPTAALQGSLPSTEELGFRVEPLKMVWKGTELSVESRFEYLRSDGGSQKGHFLLVAQSAQGMKVYPETAFTPQAQAILQPKQGEYFSFGRYRQINAGFGTYGKKSDVKSVTLYVFDVTDRLLFKFTQKSEESSAP